MGLILFTFGLLMHAHLDHIYGLNELLVRDSKPRVFTNDYGRLMMMDDKKNMFRYNGTHFIFQHLEKLVIVNDGDETNVEEVLWLKLYLPWA